MSTSVHLVVDNTQVTNFIQDGNTSYVDRNVGIGYSNPSHALDVNGSINVSGKIKENNNELLPYGSIMMWSGSIATIPTGWILCDGTNGTPDMRNRFVVGAGTDSGGVAMTSMTGSLTKTGGSKDSVVPVHSHLGNTTSTDGAHSHTYYRIYGSNGVSANIYQNENDGEINNLSTTSSGSHQHTFTTDSTGTSGINANLPPYYALAYIMKNV